MDSNSIDLWLADCQHEDIERCRLILNAAELERAERFKTQQLQQSFIAMRAILRQILARYQRVSAENIVFELGQYGKPFISGQREGEGLVFNISHCANKLAVIIGYEQRLGVDIERHKANISLPGLVKKCFAENEVGFWQGLPESEQAAAFFDIWTRKESFVKAVGRGIALGLDQCVTSIKNPEQWHSIPETYGLATDWKIYNLAMPQGYSGAISTNKLQTKLNIYTWFV
jgi:4'-phosphopantetheinyl transferase